ncbi:MAG: inositol monophosphatase family protein [Marinobacter sp.]|uniref:inositol monophosphatase family protein n=1 Tax=Marinobacter sp. TaxID=50741 RepID=UPI00299F37AB|nr:inositol monophosphatase family protein [Marinobacter sp.]MDX1757304.1 inositol monophosphatase family protein [Marinobacter sp.]
MQPAIKMALRVARQGSDYLKAHFERQDPADKDPIERGRQLDRVAQSIYDNFSEQLQKAYKDHVIAPINEADAGNAEHTWHIFPVLGRDNFLRNLPDFALALIQKKGNRTENLLLVNPVTGEEYTASRGHGAALNSRRVRTGTTRHLSEASLVTNLLDQCKGADDPLLWGELTATLAQQAGKLHTAGCASLDIARVAAGHLDAAVIFRPQPEDLAVGLTIAMESGALAGDFSGNPSTSAAKQLVIANPKLFKEVLKTLHPFQGRLPR